MRTPSPATKSMGGTLPRINEVFTPVVSKKRKVEMERESEGVGSESGKQTKKRRDKDDSSMDDSVIEVWDDDADSSRAAQRYVFF